MTMVAVQIVGGLLMALGALLLVRRVVGTESDLQIPGVTLKAPASVLILIVGVLVFLFPWSPWWPENISGGGPTPSPSVETSLATSPSPPASVASPTPTPATPVSAFIGAWKNVDPNTRSLVEIDITGTATGLTVHPWGACSPTPCDWGSQMVTVPLGASAFDVFWDQGFATVNQHYQLNVDGTLTVSMFTHFTDNSGRSDYTSTDQLAEQ
jgi:hypothetical protein